MSLTQHLMNGLDSLTSLPGGQVTAVAVVTAATGAAILTAWNASNPVPIGPGGTPRLSPRKTTAAPPVSQATVAPLDIPLDVVPKDDRGRTPYDIVGTDAIAAAVEQFYSKVCADPELEEFFTSVDMKQLKRHQAAFIAQLWGGPVSIPLERLAAAHQHLRISPERYWRVAGHLMVTLTHLEVPDWICIFTMTRLYQARTLIVTQEWLPPATRIPDDGGITVTPAS